MSLEYIFGVAVGCYPVKKPFAEIFFNIGADDVDNFAKATSHGVVGRIIKKAFVVWADCSNLFDAAVTASHAGCKD